MAREKRRLPPDEIDTTQEKARVLENEPVAEKPYDPGGLGELNDRPERRDQATPRGRHAGKRARSGRQSAA